MREVRDSYARISDENKKYGGLICTGLDVCGDSQLGLVIQEKH